MQALSFKFIRRFENFCFKNQVGFEFHPGLSNYYRAWL